MKKGMKKLIMAMFVMAATLVLAPTVDAKAYGITQVNPAYDSITVTWTAEEDATGYSVYVGEDSSTATLYTTLPAGSTSVTIAGLPAGCERYVKVEYTYINSYSGATYTRTVGSDYDLRTIPNQVTNLNQTKWWYFALAFDAQWDEVEAADGYEYVVYNSKNKKMAAGEITSNYPRFSYNPSKKEQKTFNKMVYKAQVRAYSTICGQKYYTAWTPYAYFFTQPRVKSVKAANGSLTIKWDKITGATGYDVYVSTKPTTGYKKVKSVGKNTSSVTVKKLGGKKIKKNKKYYVYVASTKKVKKIKYTSGKLYYWNSKSTNFGYF